MNMTHRLAVSTVIAGLCACHSSRPVTEVQSSKSQATKQLERIDYSLLFGDSLFVIVDNPEVYITDSVDSTSSPPVRKVSLRAKSLQLRHGSTIQRHDAAVAVRQDSVAAQTVTVQPVKSKSTTATRAVALFAGIFSLLFILYKFRRKC